jgi:hypothetical protein
MTHIPETRKKLREATFFLGQLSNKAKAPNLESEEAEFYLSAFLSAGSSVICYCRKEGKKIYRDWARGIPETDQKRLRQMEDLRNAEVHQGADVRPEIESIPVWQAYADTIGPHAALASSIIACDPPGIPPAEVGQRVLYFTLSGKTVEVVKTCKLYLSLLQRLVNDFEQHSSVHPPSGPTS